VIPPSSSAKVSQRYAPVTEARTQSNLLLEGVMVRQPESSDPGSAASNAPTANPGGTRGALASDFFVEADPETVVRLRPPDIGGLPPPLIEPIDLLRMKDVVSAEQPKAIREVGIAPPPGRERNPSNRSDALWIQTKLHDLGYYTGNISGVWGSASRNALRDFKTMNGLQEDDKWDQETEERLLSRQGVRASSTFMGGWAPSIDECQHLRGRSAPLVIRPRGAETDGGKCSFRSVKQEAATTWRVQAACSAEGQSWNANISLKLTGSNLNWSSERGTETYVRCSKS